MIELQRQFLTDLLFDVCHLHLMFDHQLCSCSFQMCCMLPAQRAKASRCVGYCQSFDDEGFASGQHHRSRDMQIASGRSAILDAHDDPLLHSPSLLLCTACLKRAHPQKDTMSLHCNDAAFPLLQLNSSCFPPWSSTLWSAQDSLINILGPNANRHFF